MEKEIFSFLPKETEELYFIGIGGISMSALAMIARRSGYSVSGSDVGSGDKIGELICGGVTVNRHHAAENLSALSPKGCAVVYTSAVAEDNPELVEARRRGFKVYTRSAFLGELTGRYGRSVGVAGMHGKSTVCGMLAEIFTQAELDPSVICGADIPTLGGAYRVGGADTLIFEACEYKDAFLGFHPTLAAVTNIEAEHLDYFGSIERIRSSFTKYVSKARRAVINTDSEEAARIAAALRSADEVPRPLTCSRKDGNADLYADKVTLDCGFAEFTARFSGEPALHVRLSVPGIHNADNALLAAAVAFECGISPDVISRALESFRGIGRRLERVGELNGAEIYDDYAHHPTEIKATLAAARAMGFERIICAFQPHTYSRTAAFFSEFVAALKGADEVILADIYAAREKNLCGISSAMLASALGNAVFLRTSAEIEARMREYAEKGTLLLTMGAGELHRVARALAASAR